jgi:hypothetical protein
MFAFFTKPTASQLAADALHDAQRDLLTAEACAEHYYHTVLCLRERIERLELHVELSATPLPAPRRVDHLPKLATPL